MEIRANYIIVGCFTLAVLLGSVLFTLWIAKQDKDLPMHQYDISFNESVAGLSVNNDVLFSGIRVGSVTQIKISDTDPGAVRVRITIAADTPVREDSEAKLEIRGLTGVSVVSISGGSKQSHLSRPAPGSVGTIRYRPSPLASVVQQFPDTIAAANETLHRVSAMLSNENQASFTTSLQSMATLTSTLANRADSLNSIILHAESTIEHIDAITASADKILNSDVRQGSAALAQMAKRLDDTFRIMEPGLKQFSKDGLNDMRMLMVETRNLVHILSRISQKLESDPRRFFLGDPVQEYHPR